MSGVSLRLVSRPARAPRLPGHPPWTAPSRTSPERRHEAREALEVAPNPRSLCEHLALFFCFTWCSGCGHQGPEGGGGRVPGSRCLEPGDLPPPSRHHLPASPAPAACPWIPRRPGLSASQLGWPEPCVLGVVTLDPGSGTEQVSVLPGCIPHLQYSVCLPHRRGWSLSCS